MARRDIIVIGGSAGAIDALCDLFAQLPADLPAAVFVVVHTRRGHVSALPSILASVCPLPIAFAADGEVIASSRVYVAPADAHLLLDHGFVRVRRGPKENRHRPAIDALFRSAAYVYDRRVIGVLLSGFLDDGVSGLWSIKRLGGLALAQSPEDAAHPDMPKSAIEQVEMDFVAPARSLGAYLAMHAGEATGDRAPSLAEEELRRVGVEVDIAARTGAFDRGVMQWSETAPFTCPECQGAMVRLDEGSRLRFRCHAGHAYSPRALLAGMSEHNVRALHGVLRALDEQAALLDYLAKHASTDPVTSSIFRQPAEDSKRRRESIREILAGEVHLLDTLDGIRR